MTRSRVSIGKLPTQQRAEGLDDFGRNALGRVADLPLDQLNLGLQRGYAGSAHVHFGLHDRVHIGVDGGGNAVQSTKRDFGGGLFGSKRLQIGQTGDVGSARLLEAGKKQRL